MMSQLFKFILVLLSIFLTGCATTQPSQAIALPLAEDDLTLLFFYTDN